MVTCAYLKLEILVPKCYILNFCEGIIPTYYGIYRAIPRIRNFLFPEYPERYPDLNITVWTQEKGFLQHDEPKICKKNGYKGIKYVKGISITIYESDYQFNIEHEFYTLDNYEVCCRFPLKNITSMDIYFDDNRKLINDQRIIDKCHEVREKLNLTSTEHDFKWYPFLRWREVDYSRSCIERLKSRNLMIQMMELRKEKKNCSYVLKREIDIIADILCNIISDKFICQKIATYSHYNNYRGSTDINTNFYYGLLKNNIIFTDLQKYVLVPNNDEDFGETLEIEWKNNF